MSTPHRAGPKTENRPRRPRQMAPEARNGAQGYDATCTDSGRAPAVLIVTLPLPPSTNHLFATVGGRRIKTRHYTAWLTEAGYTAGWRRLVADGATSPPWEAFLSVYGLPRRRDLDNTIKPVLDLAVQMTGLQDNWCESVTALRVTERGPARVELTISVMA